MTVRLERLRAIGAGGESLSVRGLSAPRVLDRFVRVIGETRLASMATVGPGGRAHIHTAYVAYSDELDFVFLSDPRSRHARNLARNPSCAMTVFSSDQTWGRPDRGVQLFGRARVTRGRDAARAEATYAGRFRAYRSWKAGSRAGDAALGWRFFRFRPNRAKVFDERALGSGVFVSAAILRDVASVRRASGPGRAR